MTTWWQQQQDEEFAKKQQQLLDDEEFAKKLQSEDASSMNTNPLSTQPQLPGINPFSFVSAVGGVPRRNVNQEYVQVIQRVARMSGDSEAKRLAGKYGLHVNSVTWEDSARSKNSSWGPCISDMTLQVEGSNLPVIRSPNYEDLTWDVPLEKIPLIVGNEQGKPLRTINLREYLQDFPSYMHSPLEWRGPKRSLLAPRDSCAIMSSQACFLPIPKEGGESSFNVALFNYQSRPGHPAVLVIVANERGTSAQIVESGSQKLYFNDNGQRCSFIGQRLSEHRIEQGQTHDLDKPMNEQEKQKNMLLIVQIPLKHLPPPPRVSYSCITNASMPMAPMKKFKMESLNAHDEADVEDAILKIGASEGVFRETGNLEIEREPNYPIRITLQFYKATSNGVCNESHIAAIDTQLKDSRKFGTNVGSLVVGGNTGRPTEHTGASSSVFPPPWWSDFWLMYKNVYPQYTAQAAADLVFKNGRFMNSSMNECQTQVLDILGGGSGSPGWKLM